MSLGPRLGGETEGIGKIAMLSSVSRPHAVDGMMIGRRAVSISRDVVYHRASIWSRGLNGSTRLLWTLLYGGDVTYALA